MSWNLAESFLHPTVYVNNLTSIKSGTKPPTLQYFFGYYGPADINISNVDVTGAYQLKVKGVFSFGVGFHHVESQTMVWPNMLTLKMW